jgi:hypothetical protein
MPAGPVRRGTPHGTGRGGRTSVGGGLGDRAETPLPHGKPGRPGRIVPVSDSFSERMRRRWARRRDDSDAAFGTPGGAPGAGGGTFGHGPFGGPGADAPGAGRTPGAGGNPFEPGADSPEPGLAGALPGEHETTTRARLLHERLREAYAAGDVATVSQLADLMPDGPSAQPYRAYGQVLAAEARADDAQAVELARGFLERLHPADHEWETARTLFGEVAVQALVMGAVPLAGNLTAAEDALRQTDYMLHPSGALLKFAEEEEGHPLLLVLHGKPEKAVRAARREVRAEKRGTRAGYADALCTYALAACAAGDIDAAREALAEADRVLPGRPRITATRARIETSPAATVREE